MKEKDALKNKDDKCYQTLRSMANFLLRAPEKNIVKVSALEKTDRYKNDKNLQLIVECVKDLYFVTTGDSKSAITSITKTIKKANQLKLYVVLPFCYNLLGVVYSHLGFLEKSYHEYNTIITIEDNHGFSNMKSAAYNNIGILFERLGDRKSALGYFYKSLQLDMKNDLTNPINAGYLLTTMSNYIMELCKNDDTENATKWFNNLCTYDWTSFDLMTLSAVYEGHVYYYIQIQDYKKSEEYYVKMQETFDAGLINDDMYRSIANYGTFCKLRNVPYQYYIPHLQKYEDNNSNEFSNHLSEINYVLNSYYEDIGDEEKLILTFRNYMKFSEINKDDDKNQQLKALNVMVANDQIMQENFLLNKLTKELEESNKALELAGKHLDIVHKIGRKVTATLNLNEIAQVVHDFIYEILPVDFFVIFIVNESKTALESLTIIEDGISGNNFCISLSNTNSYEVECYKTALPIFLDEISQSSIRQKMCGSHNLKDVDSALFIPITYEEQTIGVFTLQSVKKNFFKPEHKHFFDLIGQYIAIAINNVKHSLKLNNEIESHKETQRQLEEANRELKKLAVMDELTHIYNRREFYNAYLTLMQEAVKTKQPISVLMMDIDKFKTLNDTYGHLEGDKALVAVAQTICKVITKLHSVIARFGGEEFIAVSVGENEHEIAVVAEKIRAKVQQLNIENKNTEIGVLTISIGVSTTYKPDIENRSELLKIADDCLYAAKDNGRNQIHQRLV